MAEGPELSELVRRTIEANTKLYQGWVNLSLEYFRGITEIFSGVQEAVATGSTAGVGTSPETTPGAVVLEGEEGSAATGAFLVTNDLGRTLKCELEASGFEDAAGDAAPARVTFDPPSLELQPGEQRVVKATVPVDGKLEAGVAYTGTFGIKGMTGFSVPVVLRRQHGVEGSPIDRVDEEVGGETSGEASRSSARSKTSGAKKTGSKPAKAKAAGASASKAPGARASKAKSSSKKGGATSTRKRGGRSKK